MSRLQEYKEKNGTSKVNDVKESIFDDINKKALDFLEQDSAIRLGICNSCDHLIKLTKECKKDKSFVLDTVKIKEQKCPIGAW